ncbi:MAG: hypothetical protein EBT06_10495 [Gammaproteobacteria bacterium]|nr:hypothetical protein [Gammaproteobacteria bacterium]
MKKPSFYPALDKKPEPQSIEEAEEAIRLLHETIASLTERAKQLAFLNGSRHAWGTPVLFRIHSHVPAIHGTRSRVKLFSPLPASQEQKIA